MPVNINEGIFKCQVLLIRLLTTVREVIFKMKSKPCREKEKKLGPLKSTRVRFLVACN